MNPINKRILYLIAGVIWGVPGVIITAKGISAYTVVPANELWWLLIVCMSCLGIALKFVSFIPAEFTASFYSGLGPALIVAGFRFVKWFRII